MTHNTLTSSQLKAMFTKLTKAQLKMLVRQSDIQPFCMGTDLFPLSTVPELEALGFRARESDLWSTHQMLIDLARMKFKRERR